MDECKPLLLGAKSGELFHRFDVDAVTWRQRLTLVPIFAQLELILPLSAPLELTSSPIRPTLPVDVSRRCLS